MKIEMRVPRIPDDALAGVVEGLRRARFEHRVKLAGDGSIARVQAFVPNTIPALRAALGVLDGLNFSTMRHAMMAGVVIPSVYDLHRAGRLVYKPEPPGREFWQTWIDNIEQGEGDCEDLASHESQRQRLLGAPTRSDCIQSSPTVYHAIVRHGAGDDAPIEDPSMPLGLWWYREQRRREKAGQKVLAT